MIKLIAFYLPQYHPIPENDSWWGKGFTEWSNVVKARPLFRGHYQPHLPSELGFYDLRVPETRLAQAMLAEEYGISGFCYYHYWFNGRKILDRPLNEVLATGSPDFPFCLCWANENWTRVWDGGDKDVLLEQFYNKEDDLRHIRHLLPIFADKRYIRIDGKPVFLIYRSELLPNIRQTIDIWREEAARSGVGDIYLIRVESFSFIDDLRSQGFDAALNFSPNSDYGNRQKFSRLNKLLLGRNYFLEGNAILDYEDYVKYYLSQTYDKYKRYRCAMVSFDNSPRRRRGATIFTGSTPDRYYNFLKCLIDETLSDNKLDEPIVFINAWNEWGEGNYLEPDVCWGRGYLENTLNALNDSRNS
jgi:lipopolysaccharide biosynthesis protein